MRGTMVLFGGASGQVPPFDIQRLNKGGSLKLTRPNVDHFVLDRAELLGRAADLFGWVADGSLKVLIGGPYPLAEAAAGAGGSRRAADHRKTPAAALSQRWRDPAGGPLVGEDSEHTGHRSIRP